MQTANLTRVSWNDTHRIIRSKFPPIDLFEDIADPADWDAILSAESKTNPRIAESVGKLNLVPKGRRVTGHGASWAMAPFTHTSKDRPSRFTDGSYGVYYAGNCVKVALFESIYHHEKFMASTNELPGWTSDFRELVGTIDADLHDISQVNQFKSVYDLDHYAVSQKFAAKLRASGSNGILYQSVRYPSGMAVALFWPDVASIPTQGRHFSYYWDGTKVIHIRNLTTAQQFEITT